MRPTRRTNAKRTCAKAVIPPPCVVNPETPSASTEAADGEREPQENVECSTKTQATELTSENSEKRPEQEETADITKNLGTSEPEKLLTEEKAVEKTDHREKSDNSEAKLVEVLQDANITGKQRKKRAKDPTEVGLARRTNTKRSCRKAPLAPCAVNPETPSVSTESPDGEQENVEGSSTTEATNLTSASENSEERSENEETADTSDPEMPLTKKEVVENDPGKSDSSEAKLVEISNAANLIGKHRKRTKKDPTEVGEKFKSGKVQKRSKKKRKKLKTDDDSDDEFDFGLDDIEVTNNLVPVPRVIPTTVFEFPDELIPDGMTADLKAKTGPKLKWRDENDETSANLCEVATFSKGTYKWRSLFEKRRQLEGLDAAEAAKLLDEHTASSISVVTETD